MISVLKSFRAVSSEKNLFSILIPTWNNLDYLKLCIDSIRKNSDLKHQIIVMINEGSDGTDEWVKSQKGLSYVYSPTNIGICYGLNSCRPLMETNYMLYANDDMYFLPHWDKTLMEEVNKIGHEMYMLSSTMIEPFDTQNPCVIVSDFGDSIETFQENNLLKKYEKLDKPDWSGSTWPPNLLPVKLWDLVGGMSTEFSPGMYSDPDLSKKLWDLGVRYFKGVGKSKVYHFGSKSTGRVKRNPGHKTFLVKWGMTGNSFITNFLKRGEIFTGPLPEPEISFSQNSINKFKRVWKCLT